MKTCIIATDFSAASFTAAKYALAISIHFPVRIILFNAYNVPVSIPESYFIINPEDIRKEVETKLFNQLEELRPYAQTPIECQASEGVSTESILEFASQFEEPVIFCGMKGEGNRLRKLFGSTVTGLARKSTVPIWVVPAEASFEAINQIVLACDEDMDAKVFDVNLLKKIGGQFNALIHLVRVQHEPTDTRSALEQQPRQFMNQVAILRPSYQLLHDNDTTHALEVFIQRTSAQLLVVLPHHHQLFEHVFIKSETRALLFQIHIPLLLLPVLEE